MPFDQKESYFFLTMGQLSFFETETHDHASPELKVAESVELARIR